MINLDQAIEFIIDSRDILDQTFIIDRQEKGWLVLENLYLRTIHIVLGLYRLEKYGHRTWL